MVRIFDKARCIPNMFLETDVKRNLFHSYAIWANYCLTESAMDSKLFLCPLEQRLFDSTDRG